MIQLLLIYTLLSFTVLLGLFLVVWGLRLRNRFLRSEEDATDTRSHVLPEENGGWLDLPMSSCSPLDSDFQRTGDFTEPREQSEAMDRVEATVHDSLIRKALKFWHAMVARISAFFFRRSRQKSRWTDTGPLLVLPPEPTHSPADSTTGACAVRRGPGLAPRSLRSFFSFGERRSSRFTIRY